MSPLHSLPFALLAVLTLAMPTRADAQLPEWALREELRIGGGPVNGGTPLIGQVVVGRDGSVHSLVGREVLTFDRSGRLVRRRSVLSREMERGQLEAEARAMARAMARVNGGRPTVVLPAPVVWRELPPGSPRSLGWMGDTLWVARHGNHSFALLAPDTDSVSHLGYSVDVEDGPANRPLALLADGSLLRTISSPENDDSAAVHAAPRPRDEYRMPVIPAPPVRAGEQPDQAFLARVSPQGRILQGLEIFADARGPVTVRNPYGLAATAAVPFQDHPLITVAPDGREAIFVERYRPTRQGPATYTIARFDILGRKRAARQYSYTPRAITRSTIDSLVAGLADSGSMGGRWVFGFPSPAAARATIEAALEIPAYHPPVTEVLAGADRTLWIREHATSPWTVLGPDGAAVATITLPPGVRLVHVDAGKAWGTVDPPAGSRGTRLLLRYRLVKGSAGPP